MDYKARFYSPVLNRFIQPDSIVPNPMNPQAFNRFSYVGNRPINFNDPSGHVPIDCIGSNYCGAPKDPEYVLNSQFKPKPLKPKKEEAPHCQSRACDPNVAVGVEAFNNWMTTCSTNPILPECTAIPPSPLPYIPPSNSSETPFSVNSNAFKELVVSLSFWFETNNFLDTIEKALNYGRPFYRYVKYAISLGGFEYGFDGALQLYDDRNKNLTNPQRIARGLIRSGESFITDIISQGFGVGIAIGTGSPVGYFAGTYTSSGLIDGLVTNNINPWFFNNQFFGGP